jgi:hypothetical protein
MINMGAVIRCRLSGRGLTLSRRALARLIRITDGNKYDVYGMRLSCSRLLGTFRTSSSGIARPIMQHDKYMEDGTDTQRTRIYGIICTAYAYFRFSSRSESRIDSSVAAGSVSHHA